jgi:hypothetical protein
VTAAANNVVVAGVDAAPASAPRGRARDAKPDGTGTSSNTAAARLVGAGTIRNSQAACTSGHKNLPELRLGAGPRTPRPAPAARPPQSLPPPPQQRLPRLPWLLVLRWPVADNAATADGDTPCPPRWPDTCGHCATDATAPPADGRPRCNNALGAGADETSVHSPSKDRFVAETSKGALASAQNWQDTEMSPRER